jgi:hypothetical protein
MICDQCHALGGFEGDLPAKAEYIVTVTAPPAEAEANAPEFLCGPHAAQAAEAYIGFGWAIHADRDPGEMKECCHQHVTNPYVTSPTICACGRTLAVRDRTWQVWVSHLESTGTNTSITGGA